MCVFAMVMYVHRSCISVPASIIQDKLDLSNDDMALALSVFLWGYAALQIPGGLFGDRWGSRVVLPLLVLVSSVATGLMGLAWGLGLLVAMRFLMGAAQAGTFPCAVLTFGQWFPKGERAFPNGMLSSFMSVGAVIGSALTGLLLAADVSWRAIFVIFSLPGILLAAWFYFWFRDRPREHPGVNAAERSYIEADQPPPAERAKEPVPWLRIFTSPRMALICGQQFFRAAGYIFYLTWFPKFLQMSRAVEVSESGYLTSLPLLGVVIGSALGGVVTDWIFRRTGSMAWSRKGVAIVCLLLCAALMASGYFVADPLVCVLWLSLGSVFAGGCGPAGYTVTIDLGGKHVATVFSMMNMAGNIGAALLPFAVVWFEQVVKDWKNERFLSELGGDALAQVSRAPMHNGWNEVLFVMAGLYVAAALCWALLPSDQKAI